MGVVWGNWEMFHFELFHYGLCFSEASARELEERTFIFYLFFCFELHFLIGAQSTSNVESNSQPGEVMHL
jgi:hypothetical protein